jgi:MFS family permease
VGSGAARGQAIDASPAFLAAALSLVALLIALIELPETKPRHASPPRRSWLDQRVLRECLSTRSVGALLLLYFIATVAFGQFESTLSRLTERAYVLGERENFYLFTYNGVMMGFMQGVVIRALGPRLGEQRMIVLGTVFTGAGLWLVSGCSRGGPLSALLAIMPLLVGGFGFQLSSIQALVSRRVDPIRQGEILGLLQSIGAMGRIVAPLLGNVLFGVGISVPYALGAALCVPAFILAYKGIEGRDFADEPGARAAGG